MYRIPGTYFHPWLQPRHCATREDLLDLLATDQQWRDHVYTESERYQLRVEQAQQQEKERAATHATLVAEARHRAALQKFTALFREGTQVIAGYRRAIVISPGDPRAAIYIELDDGSFKLNNIVPASAVLPDGSIRLPKPLTPLKGGGPVVSSPPMHDKTQPASLNLTDTEYHALPSADAALNPVPPVAPDRVPLTEGGHQGRTPGSGKLYPNAHRFVEIIGKKVDSFYVDKGRWPTRQEAIDYGEWSDHKPSRAFRKSLISYAACRR